MIEHDEDCRPEHMTHPDWEGIRDCTNCGLWEKEQPTSRAWDFTMLGRRIIIGYNAEKTLRFGIHRERWFTAVGLWPLLIGIQTSSKQRQKGMH